MISGAGRYYYILYVISPSDTHFEVHMKLFPSDWNWREKLMIILFVVSCLSLFSLSFVGCTNFRMSAEKAEVEVTRG